MTEILPSSDSEVERATAAIAGAQSFGQLEDILLNLGRLVGSDRTVYSADELCGMVVQVRAGVLPLTALTRTAGLRDKVSALLPNKAVQEERVESPASPAEMIANVKDFMQLEHVLSQIGTLTSDGGQTYEADVLIAAINDIRFKGELLKTITRQEGLRQKVAELYAQEAISLARSLEDIETVITNVYASGGSIPGSDGRSLERDDLLEKIRMAMTGYSPVQMVTRSYGLRGKAIELLAQPK